MPGRFCAIYGCKTDHVNKTDADGNKETKISWHRFPNAKDSVSQTTRKAWINRCCRKDEFNPDTSRICSAHFIETDYERDLQSELLGLPIRRILKKDAVPTIGLPKMQRRRKQEFNDLMSSTENCVFINGSNNVLQEPDEPNKEENPLRDPLEIGHDLPDNPPINSPGPSGISSKKISKGVHNNYWEKKYAKLLEENKRMKLKFSKKIKSLNDQLQYYKTHRSPKLDKGEINARRLLREVLTENQIALLSKRKKRVNWTNEEISVALTISSYSKKCYLYLQNNTNFPLPSLSTLKGFEVNKTGRHM